MTALEYKSARKVLGTQKAVATMLGLHSMTITKRECGMQAISKEAELAILSLKAPQATKAPGK